MSMMEDEEVTDEQPTVKDLDPFKRHFETVLSDDFADSILQKKLGWKMQESDLPGVGRGIGYHPEEDLSAEVFSVADEQFSLSELHVKQSLSAQVSTTNVKLAGVPLQQDDSSFTPLQRGLFAVVSKYVDLYYPKRGYANAEEVRLVYCLHAVNHVLKTRSRVLVHNAKLKSRSDDVPDEYRDQGLTRPKVLILLPFRNAALCAVNMMSHLLSVEQQSVMNKARFESEYGSTDEAVLGKKPEDFEATFKGNIDDNFRIGISITKKSVKLYTKFLSSDIIIASPVSLRAVMEPAKKGDSDDCDFLSSIEMVIVDQADVLFMQNWDNVLRIFECLNCQPKESHGVDFARVRMWSLNGWSRLYRQTLVFSEFDLQPLRALLSRHCLNYAGQMLVKPASSKCSWTQVVVRMRHEFCRFYADSPVHVDDRRFEYFTSKILPLYTDTAAAQTLIFVSSSLDFIRVRNELVRREIEFVQLSEYSDTKETQRARGSFVHGKAQLALLSERFHFFRRYNHIRGTRHIVFYDLPSRPHFYAEICNWVRDLRRPLAEDSAACRVLYCKYDILRLRAILGNARMQKLLLSEKDRYFFNPPALELHT